jgi:large subunit ribosomal protein L29
MKIKDLQNKTIAGLENDLKENRDKLRDLKFKVAQRQLKNIREIRNVKKTIARILTIIKHKESATNEENK